MRTLLRRLIQESVSLQCPSQSFSATQMDDEGETTEDEGSEGAEEEGDPHHWVVVTWYRT